MKKRGFTLVEIMIVVAIIGLLAAIAIPSFTKIRAESRKSACQNGQRLVRDAVDQWAMANNIAEGGNTIEAEVVEFIKGNTAPLCPEGNVAIAIPATVGAAVVCPVASVTALHTLP
ncbi:MAG: prepilin-type N-terminal cleavage/methylation domain-containing protein [Kiritimatiellia bacterium]